MTVSNEDVYENFSAEVIFNLSTEVIENNSNETTSGRVVEQMAMTLNVYYTPVLIVLGCLGNLISLFVFFKSKLRLQSTSQYLSALAISDTLFLGLLLPSWLEAVGASKLFSSDGYCQLFVYLSYVMCNHSAWLVVAFTVERFVAVVYPLRRNAICTVKRARYIIGSLAAAALLVNSPVLRFAVPNGHDCNIDEVWMSHAARFNVVDTMVSFTMPLAMIMVLNTWITCSVCRHRHMQQRPAGVRGGQVDRFSACQRAQQRVTKMLLTISTVFVVLNLPAYSMRIAAYAYNMGEHEYTGKWAALQQVCLLIFNTNFGINFVLYCLAGQNFRGALLETFPCLRRRGLAMFALRDFNADPSARASSLSISLEHSYSNSHSEGTANNSRTSNLVPGRSDPSQAGTSYSYEDEGRTGRFTGPVEYVAATRRRLQAPSAHSYKNTRFEVTTNNTSNSRTSNLAPERCGPSQAGTSQQDRIGTNRFSGCVEYGAPMRRRVLASFAHSYNNTRFEVITNNTSNSRTSNLSPERCGPSQAGTSQQDRIATKRFSGYVEYEAPKRRRGQGQKVIKRWRFDNSRQKHLMSLEKEQRRESLEMRLRRDSYEMQPRNDSYEMQTSNASYDMQPRYESCEMKPRNESYELTQRQEMHESRRDTLELQNKHDSSESHQRRYSPESKKRVSFNLQPRYESREVQVNDESLKLKMQSESNEYQLRNNSIELQQNNTSNEQRRLPPGNF